MNKKEKGNPIWSSIDTYYLEQLKEIGKAKKWNMPSCIREAVEFYVSYHVNNHPVTKDDGIVHYIGK